MNAILNLGKWLYAVPFLIFGAFHFMNAKAMAGMTPFGGGSDGVCFRIGSCSGGSEHVYR